MRRSTVFGGAGLDTTKPVVTSNPPATSQPLSQLVADVFGVASPRPDAPALHPDLVIVPVLGFDRRGGRIGQGGGTYDRTLANLRGRGPVFALGLAYAGQEVDEIPQEAHDQRLDAVLTESDYFQFGD